MGMLMEWKGACWGTGSLPDKAKPISGEPLVLSIRCLEYPLLRILVVLIKHPMLRTDRLINNRKTTVGLLSLIVPAAQSVRAHDGQG